MHALAVAAFVVLLLQPEAIVTPGFQMSFAATAALVALVEIWPKRTREISAPWPIVAVQRFGGWLTAAVAVLEAEMRKVLVVEDPLGQLVQYKKRQIFQIIFMLVISNF